MKTIREIKQEILDIENTPITDIAEMKPSAWRKQLKKLELLRFLEGYLTTNPTEEFVTSETKRLEKIISSKMKDFEGKKAMYEERGVPKKEITKLKSAHEKTHDIPKMRSQVRNLRMLLK